MEITFINHDGTTTDINCKQTDCDFCKMRAECDAHWDRVFTEENSIREGGQMYEFNYNFGANPASLADLLEVASIFGSLQSEGLISLDYEEDIDNLAKIYISIYTEWMNQPNVAEYPYIGTYARERLLELYGE
jgi:hypothetical protein